MSGLTGKSTAGVGQDIVSYLREVATFFNATLQITSGFRSPDAQAQAMFDNWIKLKRGAVYKVATLPVADRQKLDDYYRLAKESPQATTAEKNQAKADFLALAKQRVGTKTKHASGRAVDISRASVSAQVYQAIVLRMKEVKEGNRKDIYHFESTTVIPAVDAALKQKWSAIKAGTAKPHPAHTAAPHPAAGYSLQTTDVGLC